MKLKELFENANTLAEIEKLKKSISDAEDNNDFDLADKLQSQLDMKKAMLSVNHLSKSIKHAHPATWNLRNKTK